MPLMHRRPEAITVSVDGSSGRPTQIRKGQDAWPVTSIEAVRDETAAYAIRTGPRTVFHVTSHDRHFRLVHLHRERRWIVESLESTAAGLAMAA